MGGAGGGADALTGKRWEVEGSSTEDREKPNTFRSRCRRRKIQNTIPPQASTNVHAEFRRSFSWFYNERFVCLSSSGLL